MVLNRVTTVLVSMILVFVVMQLFPLMLPTASASTVNYVVTGGQIIFETETGTITGFTGSPSEVVIPSTINGVNVTNLGDNAFDDCDNLTSISIPATVTSIGNQEFVGCDSLTSIGIPVSVTSIGYQAFLGCQNLTSITVDEGNIAYTSEDGVLFNKAKTKLLQCPGAQSGNYRIPNSY